MADKVLAKRDGKPITTPMLEQPRFPKPNSLSPDTASETAPYDWIPGDVSQGLLLICDHAGNAFPPGYGTLGLPPAEIERHIAYDIGAAGVTRGLAARLGVPAVLARYSRLLIDPNRGVEDPTLVMRISDGAIIPGNAHIDQAEIEKRIRLYYQPYHDAVDAAIDRAIEAGHPPAILSIHSFTDRWKGQLRPWHATILWDRDPRLVHPLIGALQCEPDLVIGENVPYTGSLEGDSLYRHGTQRGLAHALIEIRQDQIRDVAGQDSWADRLARILTGIMADETLRQSLREILPPPKAKHP